MLKTFAKEVHAIFLYADPKTQAKSDLSPIKAFHSLKTLPVRYLDEEKLENLINYDPKEKRLYNKKTLLALEGLYDLDFKNLLKQYDSKRVGIYVAGPWGKYCDDFINQVYDESATFYRAMKTQFHPKFNLKNLLAILPGHISIHFGITGPTNCFLSRDGFFQAYQKAQLDFLDEAIDLAVLVGMNVYDDSMLALRHWGETEDSRVLNEAAAIMLLKRGDKIDFKGSSENAECFGFLENISHYWRENE